MFIGVTGDTHGDTAALRTLAAQKGVAEWLHTGDFCRDARLLQELSGLPVKAVAGNNDFAPDRFAYNKMLLRGGCKIWLTHGHNCWDLLAENQRMNADIIVYGHTHVPDIFRREGILFINPGSPAFPRRGSAKGYALLTAAEGKPPAARFVALPAL
ncbi:MAG: metallophosphoesterase [Acidaminococcales bacterium]|jgi:putative phosphoesterase|nr:metallophosphoesterase [Acidaminococcales bacterium]